MSSEVTHYFGGRTAFDGKVHLLNATSFREFAQSQLFVPVPIDMTRRDFLAHADRDKIKDVAYITSAVYDLTETQRANKNVKAFNLVIIDLDGGQSAKDFMESPEAIRTALSPYNFVAWNTAKHTPEEPRLKIAVDCVESDPTLFGRTVDHVVSLLGIPKDFKGNSESHVISQLHYRPVCFKEEPFEAVIASRLDGSSVNPPVLPEVMASPDDEGSFAYVPDAKDKGICALASLPLLDITVQDVSDMFEVIDPDPPYKVWSEVFAGLRHQFTKEEEAKEVFEIVNDWASRGAKYRGRAEILLKWRSFKPYPEGRNPITLRSLIQLARDSGWKPDKIIERNAQSFTEWVATASQSELTNEGIKRIAAMPIKSSIHEEVMADQIVGALKTAGMKISKAAILKDVARHRVTDRFENARSSESPSWLKPFCFIGPQDRFRNNITGVEYSTEAFNHTFSRNLITETAEATADGKSIMTPVNYAMNIAEVKIVEGVMYDPRERDKSGNDTAGREPYFLRDGRWYVNSFLEASVPRPVVKGSKRAGNLVKKLLSANLGNPIYERMVLDFLAYCVQFPGEKIRWAIFLQGGQGCGKGTLIETVAAAIGQANLKIVTGSALTGDFNDYREGCHLVYIDELFSAGSNRHEVNNKLKDGVSNTHIPVNKKFKDLVVIPNVANYFLSSNKHDALILEDSDRRYSILKSRLQTTAQVLAFKNTGVMQQIHDLIRDAPGAFRQFWLDHEISADFDPNGHAPATRFREELVEAGKNPLLIQIEDLIQNPEYSLIGGDVVHYAALEAATAFLGKNNARPSHYLHMLGYQLYENGKIFNVGGERTRIFVHVDNFVEGIDDAEEILHERITDI